MKKRIVMLGTAFDTMGGISSVVNVYRTNGLFDRWNIEYIATHCDGSKLRKFSQAWRSLFRFLFLLLTGQVGLVHAHTSSGPSFWRKAVFFMLARISSKPWLLHLHGGLFPYFYQRSSAPARWIIRYIYRHSNCVIVLSKEWKDWVQSEFGCNRIAILFNPVGIPPHSDVARDSSTLCFLGRLGRNKGIYDLLESIKRLQSDFVKLRLVAGGDGEIEEVKLYAKSLGISDRVDVLGWVTGFAKEAVIERSSIYVLPSYNENLPMSILEAMAAGLPVVSTKVGGIPTAIESGVEGFLVPPGDINALTNALRTLLGDESLRQRMGVAARNKAVSLFSAEKVVADLELVYRGIGIHPKGI